MAAGCIECYAYLDKRVFYYSIDEFGAPLCRLHQEWIRNCGATKTAIDLYFALKRRGVPAKLEKWDGYKTIDIAIPDCKLNIEVDGMQHNSDANQALSDLQRTYHSFLKGYLTLRVPNSLIYENLDEAAEYIFKFLEAKDKQNWKRYW